MTRPQLPYSRSLGLPIPSIDSHKLMSMSMSMSMLNLFADKAAVSGRMKNLTIIKIIIIMDNVR